MKIVVSGSIAFHERMIEIKKNLESLGHQVKLPPSEVEDENGQMIPAKEYYSKRKSDNGDEGWIWDRMGEAMKLHFKKIEWGDAILVLNYDKNDIPNYIGPSAFLEMGTAFYLEKKIFLLNGIPEMNYKEEILGMNPMLIDNDLQKIK
jgi:hypothetical protein